MQTFPAFAYNSDQQKISSAVDILKIYGYQKNVDILDGRNYTKKPVSIVFKNLTDVDFSYTKFYAITAVNYIFYLMTISKIAMPGYLPA